MEPSEISAIRVILNDHRRIRGLYSQLETLDLRAPEMKPGVVREFLMELELHSRIEQELFYPRLGETGEPGIMGIVDQGFKDHERLDRNVQALREENPSSQRFNRRVDELFAQLEPHLETEERDLLPAAERVLNSDELQSLGERMLERRRELYREPRYRDAHARVAQDPHGGEQKRRDTGSSAA